MNFKYMIKWLLTILLAAAAPLLNAAQPSPPARGAMEQQGYATADDAAAALAAALRAQDLNRVLAVIGPESRAWLTSGDEVADRGEWERFIAAYDRKHVIGTTSDGRAILVVGADDWPFPAPLVRRGERWFFDAAAGAQELLNRRIGRNELDTIQTLLAIVDAQREYAAGDLDGNGSPDYALRFVSTPGKRDGLFWPVAESTWRPDRGGGARRLWSPGQRWTAEALSRLLLSDTQRTGQGRARRCLQLPGRGSVDRRLRRTRLPGQVWRFRGDDFHCQP